MRVGFVCPSNRQSQKQKENARAIQFLGAADEGLLARCGGLGAIIFAPAASATIITTGPLNIPVPKETPVKLEVAGTTIMLLSNTSSTFFGNVTNASVRLGEHPGNEALGYIGMNNQVSPVDAGQPIPGTLGSAKKEQMASLGFTSFVGTKYLGFSFGSGPNIHYGWVQFTISQNKNGSFNVTIDQAAYEAATGVPILAGATTDAPRVRLRRPRPTHFGCWPWAPPGSVRWN